MKNFVTPSLSVFKSDAAVMLREFREGCPVAVKRLSHTKSFKRGNVRLGTCLRVIASEYGTTYRNIAAEEQMISNYTKHCYAQGYWNQPYEGQFRRARFGLQFDALIECLRDQVPLAVAATKRDIDFRGFHFSSLLFSKIHQVLERRKVPDFSHLQAPGSLVHWHWLLDVTSFSHSNFKNAKFYSVTADPLVRPGASCWKADFSKADLQGADFRGSYLRGARFFCAKVDGVDFRNANIFECNFTGAEGTFVGGNVPNDDWAIGPNGVEKRDDELLQ
jgi:hypothetical protein